MTADLTYRERVKLLRHCAGRLQADTDPACPEVSRNGQNGKNGKSLYRGISMTFNEHLAREYRRQFSDFIQYDKGASRSIARRATREVAPGTIAYRLPLRRKIRAYARAFKHWRADHE